MDFSLSDEAQATRDLAKQILGDLQTPERHRELEKAGEYTDAKTWSAFADAGLLGIAIPETHGGAGLGFLEVAAVLEEIGRTTAKVPYLATVVLGALPIAEFGSAEQQAEWLPRIASGDAVVTTALVEPRREPSNPATTATQLATTGSGDSWTLSGTKDFVMAGLDAALVLVPAKGDGGVTVFLVDPKGAGVTIERVDNSTGIPEARLTFDGAPALGVLGAVGQGAEIADWITLRANAGLASIASGVCDAALRITADYTKTREQFGRPIATFQAVSQRAGDAYIDTEAVRLTALQAAWRISAGLPAEDQVAIAKFWAADGGDRVVRAAQHLHGGMGVDRDYPVHRYYVWAKWLELSLGGATAQLRKYGKSLADQRV
jgi:alkylation response protein AidB-like acyl-CoA dehydrogenase